MTITGGWAKALIAVAVLSIGLNLFLAGFMIAGGGPGFHGSRHGWWAKHFGGRHSQVHEMFHDELAARGFDRDKMRDEMRKARERVAELLQADTVDRAALEAALAPMVEQMRGLIDAAHGAMLDLAVKLPAEERKDLAKALLRHRGPGFGGDS
jgi:Spy/CpxP family protein refolding chaperone